MFEKIKTKIDVIHKTVDNANANFGLDQDALLQKFTPHLPNLNTKSRIFLIKQKVYKYIIH